MSVPKGYKYKNRKKPKPFSEEHKRKIRENSPRYWQGKTRSEETKQRISKTKKENPTKYWLRRKGIRLSPQTEFKKGNRPWNWNNGGLKSETSKIRVSVEFKRWRKAVFERDNYSCRKCEASGVTLNAHHISNFLDFPELRMEVSNGITFCEKCHKTFHKIYSRFGNTREQVEDFLKPINNELQP